MMLLEKEPANRFPTRRRARHRARHGDTCRAARPGQAAGDATRADGARRRARRSRASTPRAGRRSARDVRIRSGASGRDAGARRPLDELRRWEASATSSSSGRKVAPYLFVNGVIVLALDRRRHATSSASPCSGASIIAFKYAKLWSEGYDWRDVFRQPRESELIDVAEEFSEYMRAMFNREKRRARLRERTARASRARRSCVRRRCLRRAEPHRPTGAACRRRPSLSGPNARTRATGAIAIATRSIRRVDTLPDRGARARRRRASALGIGARRSGSKRSRSSLEELVAQRRRRAAAPRCSRREISRLENRANPARARQRGPGAPARVPQAAAPRA